MAIQSGAGSAEILIPDALPVLPLREAVVFPLTVVPLLIDQPASLRLVDDVMRGNRMLTLMARREGGAEPPGPEDVHRTGTAAIIHQLHRVPDGSVRLMVQGIERVRVLDWISREPYLVARVQAAPDQAAQEADTEAVRRAVVDVFRRLVEASSELPDELGAAAVNVTDARQLVYFIASVVPLPTEPRQMLLEMDPLPAKLRQLLDLLQRELAVRELGRKITSDTEERLSKRQREYYLREQLRSIQKELGEDDEPGSSQVAELRRRIEEAGLPEEARREADRELARLGGISPASPEHGMVVTYLEWLAALPWRRESGGAIDVGHARRILDEDHYDLEKIKDRILEYLAVKKLRQERAATAPAPAVTGDSPAREPILCFVGPPGVGKTSLGQSIARALGRRFVRMSLGGVRDEAEIRGHRRTYIGALPGRLVRALRDAGTMNPVILLDEVDKIGADWRGDPSSALLEVLDPAQNHTFRDHYLEVDLDLSDVLFLATANMLETIPGPLLDRMEVIRLDGYTHDEKVAIARDHLFDRQRARNGLREGEVEVTDAAIGEIVDGYTREAGVRNLERELGKLLRKAATAVARGSETPIVVDAGDVPAYLKRRRFHDEAADRTSVPGVATGLAVTGVGGDVLFVEATSMSGESGMTVTGQLGDVMKESAQIALSYVRSKADALGIDRSALEGKRFHVHFPAGAIPKDGPSAGITMTTALVSLLRGTPVRSTVAMTGEVTLSGRVLAIGGVKQKVLAAHRAGLREVILPLRNEADLDDVPEAVRAEMTFHPVDDVARVLELALEAVPASEPAAA